MRTPDVVLVPAPHAGPHLITQQAAHNTAPPLLAEFVEAATVPLPGVPTASDLAALDPAVAITLLVVVGLAIAAFYLGPAIRARFTTPRQDPGAPPAGVGVQATAQLPGPAPAVERAEERTDRFVDHLLRQIESAAARETELERRLEQANREADQWQQEARRLETMLWQRRQQQ